MATVQIRNLDDDAYAVLKGRAAASGRSLQEFLRLMLERQAAEPTVDEALAAARVDLSWSDAPAMVDIVEAQRADRRR
ncbi:FitA-like ribbon-helix-helix domain-containing protein [Nocardioides jensenii]|uniref:FitA-like ribbon-helix-helix domain-containing protein n=1 Tax=Nocardioides jensenii TaxID=1843 RepID=UPI0008360043|nr:hypothetical protein [Nocardioides jensenii]